jgi:Family of unknown function (DUF6314)
VPDVGETAESRLPGGTADYLRGRWQVERAITDFRSGQSGSFAGSARCAEPVAGPPGALSYQEQGELTFGRHRGPASRSLLYVARSDGAVDVRFGDGRPFYRLDLASGACSAEHPCGSDSYLVTIRVLSPGAYIERWRVRGPGKDYVMTTTMVRIPG